MKFKSIVYILLFISFFFNYLDAGCGSCAAHRDIQDGILAIELKYVIPEEMRPRKISIGKNEVENDTTHTSSAQLLNENS